MSASHRWCCIVYALIIAVLRVYLSTNAIAQAASMFVELVLVIALFDGIASEIHNKK